VVLFGYGFDLNSTDGRKKPVAALEAFQLAFPRPHLPATFGRECNNHPLSEHVALLIKTFPPQGFRAEWHWLQARAAEDSRIVLIAESLPRHELLALYGCCDVFLSLHRSEGFGRGMAEALQLGVDVIATDFGGNTDFCTGPLAHPVRWRPAPIPRGAYPWADGHGWAEPDLEHAAEVCRAVAARRLALAADPHAADPSRDPAVLASYRERFSFAVVGGRYRVQLEQLWADREGVGARLRWRGDRSPVGW
jgi:glycosyltransferase involved in cell wall biosynthesis